MRPARKGARAVEWTGLENRQERKLLVGSNPTPSATPYCFLRPFFFSAAFVSLW